MSTCQHTPTCHSSSPVTLSAKQCSSLLSVATTTHSSCAGTAIPTTRCAAWVIGKCKTWVAFLCFLRYLDDKRVSLQWLTKRHSQQRAHRTTYNTNLCSRCPLYAALHGFFEGCQSRRGVPV